MAIERWESSSLANRNNTAALTAEVTLFGHQPVDGKQVDHLQPQKVHRRQVYIDIAPQNQMFALNEIKA